MLRDFILQPNEVRRIQFEGQWLIVTQATGPIELTIGGTTPIVVDEKDRVHLRGDSPNDRAIRINNIAGAVNTIQLHTSDLLVDKRTAVDLQNAIEIAPDQLIGIDQSANIVQAIVQNPIELVADQSVCISPDCNVVRTENISLRYQPLPLIVFEEGTTTQTVALNTHRAQLLLLAAAQNIHPVWLGNENEGLPLPTHTPLTIDTAQEVTLSGLPGDWVHLAELIKH